MAPRLQRDGSTDTGRKRGRPPKEKPQQISNSAARLDAINGTMSAVLTLDRQIAALIEQHIKPLKDQRTKKIRNLKAETGIDNGDFRISYAVYKRSHDAEEMDEEDGNRVHDNLKELWTALGVGGQLDWLQAIEPAGGDAPSGGDGGEADDDEADRDPYDMGRAASDAGKMLSECPYKFGQAGYTEWRKGWSDRTTERLGQAN